MTKQGIKRTAVTLCSLVAMAFVIMAGLKFNDYMKAKEKWVAQKVELADLKQQIEEIQLSLERYDREQLDFQGYLFEERDVPAFLEGVSQFATDAAINILDMKTKKFKSVRIPDVVADSQSKIAKRRTSRKNQNSNKTITMKKMLTLAAMPINFKVEGTYASFVEFFSYLENFEQLLSISNIEIETTRDYPVLRCDFTLKIYSTKTLEELEKI